MEENTTTSPEAVATPPATALAANTEQAAPVTVTPPSENQRPEHIPEKFWDATKGAPDVDKLAHSYREIEKAFSTKREPLKPLGEDATPEQQAAYLAELRKATGAPEKPEDYGLKKPDNLPDGVEWNQEFADKVTTIAHKHAIPPAALKELAALHNENIQGMTAKHSEMQELQAAQVTEQLNKEWGVDAKDNWARAMRGAQVLGVDPTTSRLANDPDFIRAALKADQMVREDKGLVHGADETATYQERIARIQNSDDFQGKNGQAKQMAALETMRGLYNAINPS